MFTETMRPGFLNTCWVSLYLLIASAASPRDKYRGVSDHLPEVLNSGPPDFNKVIHCNLLQLSSTPFYLVFYIYLFLLPYTYDKKGVVLTSIYKLHRFTR